MQAVGIDKIIVQPATDFATPAPAHADPPLRSGKPGNDGRFGQPLGVDRRIEGQVSQLLSQFPNRGGRSEPTARQHDPLVDRRMPFDQLTRALFDGPDQAGMGKTLSQRKARGMAWITSPMALRRTRRMRGDFSGIDIEANYLETSRREFNAGLNRRISIACSPNGLPSSGRIVTATGRIRCQAGICTVSSSRRPRSKVSPT